MVVLKNKPLRGPYLIYLLLRRKQQNRTEQTPLRGGADKRRLGEEKRREEKTPQLHFLGLPCLPPLRGGAFFLGPLCSGALFSVLPPFLLFCAFWGGALFFSVFRSVLFFFAVLFFFLLFSVLGFAPAFCIVDRVFT